MNRKGEIKNDVNELLSPKMGGNQGVRFENSQGVRKSVLQEEKESPLEKF